jgi:hypothetical protein
MILQARDPRCEADVIQSRHLCSAHCIEFYFVVKIENLPYNDPTSVSS